ncbi:MAG TPA: Mur ligase family protein, partial [Bacteriovoracaceae bacterium]|nr:Mur ligase family protein [Bacteriovoracaceae bacterium]
MISFHHLKHCNEMIDNLNLDWDLKKRFVVDTREYQNGDAFIAIPGQRVNPLNLIKDLLVKGCEYVFYQKSEENDSIIKNYQGEFPTAKFIAVKNSIAFIQELAHLHIKEWLKDKSHTLFAISGSNGKTTHKEMLTHIMEAILPGRVVSTQKNNNNHLGVPLTLLNVSEETQFVVLELGSNHPGEIKFLCDIALPNAGITTNIGATHLEFFGTEREVFLEEGYLYYAVKENTDGKGFFLINQNDKFLKELADTEGSKRFSSNDDGQVKMTFFPDGAKLGEVEVHNAYITGQHNKSNLVTCAYISVNFFPQFNEK